MSMLVRCEGVKELVRHMYTYANSICLYSNKIIIFICIYLKIYIYLHSMCVCVSVCFIIPKNPHKVILSEEQVF